MNLPIAPLTRRWIPLRAHATQLAYAASPHRFNVVPAGRRSGKTERAKRKLVTRLRRGSPFDTPRFFAAAPTREQAKRIYWHDLKSLIPPHWLAESPRESELIIRLKYGPELYVLGMDKPERVEGQPWDGGIYDEFANGKPSAWSEHLRPALSDRNGWCDLIGTPEGRDHYFDLYEYARGQMQSLGAASEWGAYTWKSAEILPASEIESARRELDELTFQQEYEASFVSFEGRAYYAFDEQLNVAPLRYDPQAPLLFAFDFNRAPGTAAVLQEQELPNGLTGTGVIGEVWIPRNSTTPAVCRRLIADWSDHQHAIICYGDATGAAGGSSRVLGSDWDLIRDTLAPVFGNRLHFRVPRDNPRERARVNAVNSRCLSSAGERRLFVDRAKAPHVVKDFAGVSVLVGGAGELDKKASLDLTHLTDAIGYYIAYEFPTVKRVTSAKLVH